MTDLELAQHVAQIADSDPAFAVLYERWITIEHDASTIHDARHALRADVVMAEASSPPDTTASVGRRYVLDALDAVLG